MLSNLTLFSSIIMLKDMINKIKFFIQNIHYSLEIQYSFERQYFS